ncbi:unnamed protein product, partial [Lampetra planeri]
EEEGAASHRAAPSRVALSLLLVVLLLIVAQLCKNQLRRKEIHRYPALETIIHGIYNKQQEPERSPVKT